MSKVSAKDVVAFFRESDAELGELVLELAGAAVYEKLSKKAEAVSRMAKARAGRGKGKKAPKASTETTAQASTASTSTEAPNGTEVAATSPIAQARARRASAGSGIASVPHVQAPAHTAGATSVESDTII